MGLASSLYIGTTGMIAQQASMGVISDNIANTSTVGFKSSRLLFNTLMSEQMASPLVSDQIGQGVGVSSIFQDMMPGALETTTTSTDMAIGGNGFFVVSPEQGGRQYYTRAGNFRFDENGFLREPGGNILQGYKMPMSASGPAPAAAGATFQHVRLDTGSGGGTVSEPEATTEVRMMANLGSSASDLSNSESSPFTALFDRWDASLKTPLAAGAYAYQSPLSIYDSTGTTHTLTAYFDPVSQTTNATNGSRTWEYLLAVPPEEDASSLVSKKGVLMAGTLTFTPSGELSNMSAFSGASDDKTSWKPSAFSSTGLPVLNANLVGAAPIASGIDFGIRSMAGWQLPAGTASLADLGTSTENLPAMDAPNKQVLAMTNFSGASSTISQSQNGYGRGFLQTVFVDTSGTLVGKYSNGQEQSLYKIPLADFVNPQGLFREGGNLLGANTKSGAVSLGWPDSGRLGKLASSTLECSNVDLGTEFVNMIQTQRAFDANSKVISTSDQVIQTAVQMKR